jgi:Eukaryotic cytochrome b561
MTENIGVSGATGAADAASLYSKDWASSLSSDPALTARNVSQHKDQTTATMSSWSATVSTDNDYNSGTPKLQAVPTFSTIQVSLADAAPNTIMILATTDSDGKIYCSAVRRVRNTVVMPPASKVFEGSDDFAVIYHTSQEVKSGALNVILIRNLFPSVNYAIACVAEDDQDPPNRQTEITRLDTQTSSSLNLVTSVLDKEFEFSTFIGPTVKIWWRVRSPTLSERIVMEEKGVRYVESVRGGDDDGDDAQGDIELEAGTPPTLAQTTNKVIDIAAHIGSKNYVAVGWSNGGGMIPGMALISSGGSLAEYKMTTKLISGVQEVETNYLLYRKVQRGSLATAIFATRPLYTPDFTIDAESVGQSMIWAYGSRNTIEGHGTTRRGATAVNLLSGAGSETVAASNSLQIHALIMIIVFVVLLPASFMIARYKCCMANSWFLVHAGLNSAGLVLAGVSVFAVHDYVTVEGGNNHFASLHANIGMFVMVLLGLMWCLGAFRPKSNAEKGNPNAPDSGRPKWDKLHKQILGPLLPVLGFIFTLSRAATHEAAAGTSRIAAMVLGAAMAAMCAYLEVLRRRNPPPTQKKPQQQMAFGAMPMGAMPMGGMPPMGGFGQPNSQVNLFGNMMQPAGQFGLVQHNQRQIQQQQMALLQRQKQQQMLLQKQRQQQMMGRQPQMMGRNNNMLRAQSVPMAGAGMGFGLAGAAPGAAAGPGVGAQGKPKFAALAAISDNAFAHIDLGGLDNFIQNGQVDNNSILEHGRKRAMQQQQRQAAQGQPQVRAPSPAGPGMPGVPRQRAGSFNLGHPAGAAAAAAAMPMGMGMQQNNFNMGQMGMAGNMNANAMQQQQQQQQLQLQKRRQQIQQQQKLQRQRLQQQQQQQMEQMQRQMQALMQQQQQQQQPQQQRQPQQMPMQQPMQMQMQMPNNMMQMPNNIMQQQMPRRQRSFTPGRPM